MAGCRFAPLRSMELPANQRWRAGMSSRQHLDMLPSLRQLLLAAAIFVCTVDAVDESKFRTCQQGSFCRRYRKFVHEIEASGSYTQVVGSGTVQYSGNKVTAKLPYHNDASLKPLKMELSFFQDAVEGKCGITRMYITEEAPLHPRFRLRAGDVVLQEAVLKEDDVTVTSTDVSTKVTTSAPGDCVVTIQHQPFEVHFSAGGRVLQKMNSRHLMNFESYRTKGSAKHAGLADATDVLDEHLWEENFGGHTDSKPRGPAAVGIDVTFVSAADIVGLSSHASGLHLADNQYTEPYRFYNLDVFEYAIDVPSALYGAIPLATAIHRWADGSQSSASGFFFANPSEGFVKVEGGQLKGGMPGTSTGGDTNSWWLFESGVLDAFMFAGPTPHAVLQQYHTVTGWPRMPPISTLGKHQSRWNYVDVDDSVAVNRKFDQHDIPYDVLWLDIEHTDGKKYFTWHPTHFKNPDVLLDALNESRRKLVTIIDPHIKRESGYDVFETMKNRDYFTKTHSGAQYDGWCWPGTSYYPDFCNPEVRVQWSKFFKMNYYPHNRKDLYTWNDMNEPSVFNGPEVTMPRDNLHKCHTSTYGVEHRDVHNVYGYYHHGATVQGQLERAPDVRPFVLTRSFFAGSHRHGAMWTGDNMARWNHLERSVPMLLSLGLCGMSFSGADVPGFFYDPEPELFNRWHQLGIWYPFYRGHAHLETKRREPWMFGEEVTAMMRDQVTTRYQMLPVWYTLFAEWAMQGLPILRPLWYHNLDDTPSYKHANDHFLVGEGILVRAITRAHAKQLSVYLPAGTWYDFWDSQASPFKGGQEHRQDLHPNHVPVFVKSGQMLFKKMRRRRSTGTMTGDPYTVIVYGSSATGRLYVDDGDSHNFQSGAFIYDEFTFDGTTLKEQPAPQALSVGASKGLPDDPKRSLRVERIVFVGLSGEPKSARLVHGGSSPEDLQITSEKSADGSFWVATVKKPTGKLGTAWSLELGF